MNTREKKNFIRDLCTNVMREVQEEAKKMPEEWNGIELRVYLAAAFEDCIMLTTEFLHSRRWVHGALNRRVRKVCRERNLRYCP